MANNNAQSAADKSSKLVEDSPEKVPGTPINKKSDTEVQEFTQILENLSKDNDHEVRDAVSANPHTPKDVVEDLAKDETAIPELAEEVRRRVAMDPETPTEILERLSTNEDDQIRKDVAKNPNTPIDVLQKLSKDEDSDVREGVAENKFTV